MRVRIPPLAGSIPTGEGGIAFFRGGMAERPKAVVLKTTERKLRGFESLSLRQFDTGGHRREF